MNYFILFLMLSFSFSIAASDASFIVLSENVNVRSGPNPSNQILRRISFPEPITVYEIKGSGNMSGDILDKWARISNTESEWINYLFIAELPFFVRNGLEIESARDRVVKVQTIESFEGKYYFIGTWESYGWRKENESITDGNFSKIAKDYLQFENNVVMPIKDNSYIRLCKLCENLDAFLAEKYPEPYIQHFNPIVVNDNKFVLDYGIRIGMAKRQVLQILGDPMKSSGNYISYDATFIGAGFELKFFFNGSEVINITSTFYK